ncbi:Thioredoxin domain-containing protein 17 [Orchesella cincta]|uniref:Thioredoxin domain-containing protein 17 n=1 Tax=Orchesella cincta TaxID=48709 RepID=A0A1D2N649_ORCCI|nr:Thioredoxin domain-containing protein 17 [Orchesella cincta]
MKKKVAELTADKKAKKDLVMTMQTVRVGVWIVGNLDILANAVEDVWKTIQTSKKLPDMGCLIRVKVGSKEEWKGIKDNPFKKDEKLKIRTVPTLIRWGTTQRLSGPDILKIDNVMILLE